MAGADITAKVSQVLKDYTDTVAEAVAEEAERCAEGLKRELRSTSPKRTGEYRKNWQKRKTKRSGRDQVEFIVYNDKRYQLTSLLEYGHRGPRGVGFVDARPHIKKAEKKWNEEFQQAVEEAIRHDG